LNFVLWILKLFEICNFGFVILNQILNSIMSPNIIRLSPSQAAQLFGVNERSIRRAIAAGELRYIIVQGRYKINFEDIVKWSQRLPSRAKKRDEVGIGQYVEQWRIKNPKFSPSKKLLESEGDKESEKESGKESEK